VTAEEVWGTALLLAVGPAPAACHVRIAGGGTRRLRLERFAGDVTRDDEAVLRRAGGPVLDVGCGPGRIAGALARRGVPAVGVDVAPAAVRMARERGADALCRSVFDPLPGEGAWRTVLLLDGNAGIGGAPVRLLRRAAELLAPGGSVIVELDRPGAPAITSRVRIEVAGLVSEWFPWGRVDGRSIAAVAAGARLDVSERFAAGSRSFAVLT
jgi:SAM-dependent methyltransferase